jgi:hypothetical protein
LAYRSCQTAREKSIARSDVRDSSPGTHIHRCEDFVDLLPLLAPALLGSRLLRKQQPRREDVRTHPESSTCLGALAESM